MTYVRLDITMADVPHETSFFRGYRCLHANEGGFVNPVGMPNVRRALNQPPVEFTPELQDLSFDVMKAKNANITRTRWESVFAGDTAFTNRHGVEGNDPKLMDGIICAGMFTTAQIEGDYVVMYPGVHAIDATKPLPSVQQVIDNGWCFVANTGQGASGAFHFPQGAGGQVCVIYALSAPARYPREWWGSWDSFRLPNPLRYGG